MSGDHMGGDYQTDNHVTGFDDNKMVGWKTAPAGQEPPGWEWLWELKADGADTTEVTLTYDWTHVTDADLLASSPSRSFPSGARGLAGQPRLGGRRLSRPGRLPGDE